MCVGVYVCRCVGVYVCMRVCVYVLDIVFFMVYVMFAILLVVSLIFFIASFHVFHVCSCLRCSSALAFRFPCVLCLCWLS